MKAAVLCSRLINNHPLPDGNKRSGSCAQWSSWSATVSGGIPHRGTIQAAKRRRRSLRLSPQEMPRVRPGRVDQRSSGAGRYQLILSGWLDQREDGRDLGRDLLAPFPSFRRRDHDRSTICERGWSKLRLLLEARFSSWEARPNPPLERIQGVSKIQIALGVKPIKARQAQPGLEPAQLSGE